MKKVLQMFLSNAKGGRTQYMLNNFKYIDRTIFQMDFVSLSKNLDFSKDLEQRGSKIHYVSCYAEENPQKFINEINQIFNYDYDIIHIHFAFWRSFIIEEQARKARIKKIILHSHNSGIGAATNQNDAEKLSKQHFELREQISDGMADYFLACSNEAARWMYGDKINSSKIQIIRNGIDIKKYRYNEEKRKELRRMLHIESNIVIGHIGRFVYQKNHEFLINVFFGIAKQLPNAKLVLVGTGELENRIKNKVAEMGLAEKVLFLGKRNDIEQILQAMDIFLFPSRYEGFPLSLLEAQASGLSCIAGNVSPDIVLSKNTKIVELNIEKWINEILKIYSHIERNVNINSLENYDIRKHVKEVEKIYLE